MDKLTSILAIVDRPEAGGAILDKAVTLARRFGVHIDLLVGDPAHRRALSSLCGKLGYDKVTLEVMDLTARPLREIICDRIRERRPDLVVKAPAGRHGMSRWTFDPDDWKLANECPVPLLLVRDTSWADPPRFAAAVDIAGEENLLIARGILQAAGFLASGCRATLDILHCERDGHEDRTRAQLPEALTQLVREFHVGRERLQVFCGAPEKVLPPKVAARHYDVLVLGARRGGPGFKSKFGGMTSRLVDATVGDVLLIRAAIRREALSANEERSAREQRPHETQQLL